MIFFFKKNTITLDCFTNRSEVYNYFPIEHSVKHIPSWWKRLSKSESNGFNKQNNMKACQGFIDLYRLGITIPLWSDFNVIMNGTKTIHWVFSDEDTTAIPHDPEQRGEFAAYPGYAHLKIISPWIFKTKENVKWYFSNVAWNIDYPDQAISLPGILDFKYQTATNLNLLFKLSEANQILKFGMGSPIAQIYPLTEKKVIIKNHLVDDQEYKNMKRLHHNSFSNLYNNRKKLIDETIERNKCPFGFGR